MAEGSAYPELEALVQRLKTASWKDRDTVKAELLAAASAVADRPAVREFLESQQRGLKLEVRWEIDEVLEALADPPAPVEPEPEPEPEDAKRQLTAADLNVVYDDPRGLVLHKTKRGPERWFATQRDPRTGQPQTFELHPSEITQLKTQLAGSPYWVLGSGAAS